MQTQRTESKVVQVAPDYENAKIKQMEEFAWNLQSRQEIHEEGDAEGKPSLFGGSYVIKTKVWHYVKLHFVRPLSTPGLDKIKGIEAEYFSLPLPAGPSLRWPLGLGILFMVMGLSTLGEDILVGLSVITAAALCGFWYYKALGGRKTASVEREASLARRRELDAQLSALTETA